MTPEATPPTKEPKNTEGKTTKHSIKLMIKPWGTVFVNGVQMGASPPLKNLKLAEGRHKIRISNPGFPDFIHEIDVTKNASKPITHEFANK